MLQLPKEEPFFEELPKTSKKLVSVSATSVLVTDDGEKFIKVSYIYYLIQFQEGQRQESPEQVRALLDNSSKDNAMSAAFAWKLGFHI